MHSVIAGEEALGVHNPKISLKKVDFYGLGYVELDKKDHHF